MNEQISAWSLPKTHFQSTSPVRSKFQFRIRYTSIEQTFFGRAALRLRRDSLFARDSSVLPLRLSSFAVISAHEPFSGEKSASFWNNRMELGAVQRYQNKKKDEFIALTKIEENTFWAEALGGEAQAFLRGDVRTFLGEGAISSRIFAWNVSLLLKAAGLRTMKELYETILKSE